jgi:prolyl-tRNA synthetase
VPIYRSDSEKSTVLEKCEQIRKELSERFTVKLDDRDQFKPGFKFSEWELRGVPVRCELGPRDMESGQVVLVRRDSGKKESHPVDGVLEAVDNYLKAIQSGLFQKALEFREANTVKIDSYDEFKEFIAADSGFALIHWAGSSADEERLQEETKATIRCIPLEAEEDPGNCLLTGKPCKSRVMVAKAY